MAMTAHACWPWVRMAAGVGGAEGFLEVHGGAEVLGAPLGKGAEEGALENAEESGCDWLRGWSGCAGRGPR